LTHRLLKPGESPTLPSSSAAAEKNRQAGTPAYAAESMRLIGC
jgi:hypothetical protein